MARALPPGTRRDLLQGPPFALVAAERGALRITAVNRSARAGGIRPGQALADARAVLPALMTRPAEPERDHAALLALARWAVRYGPQRHVEAADGLWVDTTGVAHLYGGEARLAGDIYARLSRLGLTARIAMAETAGAAHALARHATTAARPVRCVAPGEVRTALAPMPLAALRLDADTVLLARRLGLKRIGDLYGLPRPSLARRFRSDRIAGALVARLDAALGCDAEPRAGLPEPPRLAATRSFAEPLVSADGLIAAVGELTHELLALLDAQGLGLRRARLALSRADGSTAGIAIGTAAPVNAAAHLMSLLLPKLESIDAGFGIDIVRLDALAVEAVTPRQDVLGGTAGLAREAGLAAQVDTTTTPGSALAHLADRLANRLGPGNVTSTTPAPSHIPERAVLVRPLVAPRQPQTPASAPAQKHGRASLDHTAFSAAHRSAPRPALLLAAPEPITVMAEVPDGPPLRFTWRRVEHRVAAAEGPERIAPEWWRALPRPVHVDGGDEQQDTHARTHDEHHDEGVAALGERITPPSRNRPRDYYRIEDRTGGRYWVYREGLYDRGDEDGDDEPPLWFLHGVFT